MKKIFKLATFLVGLFLVLANFSVWPKVMAQGPLVGPTAGKLATTPAGYDDMGSVLKNMGFNAEQISLEDLANLDKLKQYAAVYINCSGDVDNVAEQAAGALKQYVSDGGVVYASDFANTLISNAFPGKISFYSGEGTIGARVGNSGKVTAKVTDGGMAAALGKSTIEVNYDLPAWVVMEKTAGRVYMRGPAPIIDYSSMTSPENLQALQNIDFSNPQAVEDLQSKFAQTSSKTLPDVPYVVSFSEGKGEVLYTSFHNEAQNTADVSKVLNWFAVRAQASGIAQESRALATGEETVLLEIVDSIQKNKTKTYTFNATGEAAFTVALNFGGSSLGISIKDPQGQKIASQSVSEPPYKKTVDTPKKGKYTIEVTGQDVPTTNYPFVVTVIGKTNAAAAEQTTQATEKAASPIASVVSVGKRLALPLAAAAVLIIIVVIIVIKARKPHQPEQK